MKVYGNAALLFFVVIFSFVLFLPHSLYAKKPLLVKIGKGEAKVTFLIGTATVSSKGEMKLRLLEEGSVLREGDQVITAARSKLEIVVPDGSFLRFSENTSFTVQQIECSKKSEKRNVRLRVAFGRTWAKVKKLFFGLRPRTEIAAVNAVCGVRGTVFRMNVEEDQSILVRTYDGEVQVSQGVGAVEKPVTVGPPKPVPGPTSVPGPRKVTMEEWVYIVQSMQQIRIGSDGVAEKPEPFTEQEDRSDWVDWNKSRDEAIKDITVRLEE